MDGVGADARRGAASMAGRVVVVTGAGQGIGRALVDQFAQEQARCVIAFDRDGARPTESHGEESGTQIVPCTGDVRDPAALERMVRWVESEFGRIDVFCSNAGVMAQGGVESPDAEWQLAWDVNVMAHVHAARLVLPGMVGRSSGALVNVISAAGLLSAPDSAPYTVTKHAALGLAEVLAINFAPHGVQVCAVCPEAVDTPMLRDSLARGGGTAQRAANRAISPEEVAARTVQSLRSGEFLVTTHPHTVRAVQKKWADVDSWVRAMGAFVNRGDD